MHFYEDNKIITTHKNKSPVLQKLAFPRSDCIDVDAASDRSNCKALMNCVLISPYYKFKQIMCVMKKSKKTVFQLDLIGNFNNNGFTITFRKIYGCLKRGRQLD